MSKRRKRLQRWQARYKRGQLGKKPPPRRGTHPNTFIPPKPNPTDNLDPYAVGDMCSPTCGCSAARKKWPDKVPRL